MRGGVRMATDLRAAARMSSNQFYPGSGDRNLGCQSVSSRRISMQQNEPTGSGTRATARSAFGTGFTHELDHDRWRSQHDGLRAILFSASECGSWLPLSKLA